MEYIYVASEDNHGYVWYSRTLSGIYKYLIETKWINKDTEIWVDDTHYVTCSLEEKFGLLGWIEAVEEMSLSTFNDVFSPEFQIRSEPLIG